MTIEFNKYQGTGNDFVIIDNRNKSQIHLTEKQIRHICDRRMGIGADGVMVVESESNYDFKMLYYNADGKIGSMCGNGGRCMVQFVRDMGLKKDSYTFIATDGEHEANIGEQNWVQLKMKDVDNVKTIGQHFLLNTGSPHYICLENDIMKTNVFEKGKQIRYSKEFAAEGVNVNFVENIDEDTIYVRTYERGVEDETMSCGTGVTAAALVFAHNERGFNAVEVKTLGGKLRVEFNKVDDDVFDNIWLCGPATFVFKGEVELTND